MVVVQVAGTLLRLPNDEPTKLPMPSLTLSSELSREAEVDSFDGESRPG